jgi:hypothetical protein
VATATLKALLDQFTEGFATRDLRAAAEAVSGLRSAR